ncbi:MAG: Na+/H+ antiporter subunit E [Clostridiaceae bacterium]|nr:Na+/H+ antiporter subunit E [Clostridiaceae bacterium]
MFLTFFIAWIILNERITPEIAIFGVLIAGLLYVFCLRFLKLSFRQDLHMCTHAYLGVAYVGLLLWEILCANLAVLKCILSRDFQPTPVIVTIRPKLRKKFTRVLYANSITLTPGTITVSLEDGVYRVHCLDEAFSHGMEDTLMVRLLQRMEGRA